MKKRTPVADIDERDTATLLREQLYRCDDCGDVFLHEKGLQAHIGQTHDNDNDN